MTQMFTLTDLALEERGEEIIPLTLAKKQLKLTVDDDAEDDLIASIRDAAISLVEAHSMVRLSPVEIEVQAAGFARLERGLGVRPILSVTQIEYLNELGVWSEVPSADYEIVHGRTILPKVQKCWPRDVTGRDGAIKVTLTAGFDGSTTPVAGSTKPPKPLISAAMMMIGHLFNNREAVVSGFTVAELPMGFTTLCHNWRDKVL
jgi:uncharacterized phiE125 gp8 family phage protein